ncbi:heat shock protein 60 [Prunus dulcis]|uniref:Heat shock protein 60 n=1 Tax=Prunus dulcis TaxID=3755 RepID=A0A4Y1RAF8_PRUDU|nr:heat shock protein 60 [Prunus dulcis]
MEKAAAPCGLECSIRRV